MTRYEQEVVINFNAEGEKATVYTANPVWIRKMDKLVEVDPKEFKILDIIKKDDEIIAKTYECPKDLISIHTRRSKRDLTDEQYEALVERLKKAREARFSNKNN